MEAPFVFSGPERFTGRLSYLQDKEASGRSPVSTERENHWDTPRCLVDKSTKRRSTSCSPDDVIAPLFVKSFIKAPRLRGHPLRPSHSNDKPAEIRQTCNRRSLGPYIASYGTPLRVPFGTPYIASYGTPLRVPFSTPYSASYGTPLRVSFGRTAHRMVHH